MTQFRMQPSPSRRNNNRGSQPMRTMLGKQCCMPYACARWFPRVRRCMDMYGYICCGRMPAHEKPNTCTYIHVTDFDGFDGLGRCTHCNADSRYKMLTGRILTERNYCLTDFDGLAIYFDGKALFFDGFGLCTLKVLSRDACTPLS